MWTDTYQLIVTIITSSPSRFRFDTSTFLDSNIVLSEGNSTSPYEGCFWQKKSLMEGGEYFGGHISLGGIRNKQPPEVLFRKKSPRISYLIKLEA